MKDIFTYGAARFLLLCISIVLLMGLATVSEAQTEQDERWENGLSNFSWSLPNAPKEELDALKSRWKAIGDELKRTTNEFAGTYRDGGDMRGSMLRWAPESGFVYVYVYEWLDVLDFSYGKVTVTPTEIIFTVEREQRTENSNNQRRTTPLRWVAARWKRNNYLIRVDEMTDFGNYVAGFGEYNDFNGPCCEFTPFLINEAKADLRVKSERAVVPKEYEFFLKQPIEATIRAVGRRRVLKDYGSEGELYSHLHSRASLTTVRINAGQNQGVKRGMLFRLVDVSRDYGQYLKITRVGATFSEGVVVRDVDDEGKETYYDDSQQKKTFSPVIAGTKVTTSPR